MQIQLFLNNIEEVFIAVKADTIVLGCIICLHRDDFQLSLVTDILEVNVGADGVTNPQHLVLSTMSHFHVFPFMLITVNRKITFLAGSGRGFGRRRRNRDTIIWPLLHNACRQVTDLLANMDLMSLQNFHGINNRINYLDSMVIKCFFVSFSSFLRLFLRCQQVMNSFTEFPMLLTKSIKLSGNCLFKLIEIVKNLLVLISDRLQVLCYIGLRGDVNRVNLVGMAPSNMTLKVFYVSKSYPTM